MITVGQVYVAEERFPYGPQKEAIAVSADEVRLRPLAEHAHASTVRPDPSGALPGYRLVFDPATGDARPDERIAREIALLDDALGDRSASYFAHLAIAHLLRDRGLLPAIAFGQIVRDDHITSSAYWVEVEGFLIDFRLGEPLQPAAAERGVVRRRASRHFYGDGYYTLTWQMLANRFSPDLGKASVGKLRASFGVSASG